MGNKQFLKNAWPNFAIGGKGGGAEGPVLLVVAPAQPQTAKFGTARKRFSLSPPIHGPPFGFACPPKYQTFPARGRAGLGNRRDAKRNERNTHGLAVTHLFCCLHHRPGLSAESCKKNKSSNSSEPICAHTDMSVWIWKQIFWSPDRHLGLRARPNIKYFPHVVAQD